VKELHEIVAELQCKDAIEYALSPTVFGRWYKRYQGKEGEKCEIITDREFYK